MPWVSEHTDILMSRHTANCGRSPLDSIFMKGVCPSIRFEGSVRYRQAWRRETALAEWLIDNRIRHTVALNNKGAGLLPPQIQRREINVGYSQ